MPETKAEAPASDRPVSAKALSLLGATAEEVRFERAYVLSRQSEQAFATIMGGSDIRAAIAQARRIADEHLSELTFVTGHSLGGLLAEVVGSHTGLPGVAFAPMGPVGVPNLADGTAYQDVPWKVLVHRDDPVQIFGRGSGWQSSHIVAGANIKILDFVDSDDRYPHQMSLYCRRVGARVPPHLPDYRCRRGREDTPG